MTRIRFEDLPSTNTPRNAENLNKLNNVIISSTEPTTGEEVWIDNVNKKIHTKNDNGYEEFYNEENREVYSTSEQRIGTWIDGKPLYRKTIHSTSTTGSLGVDSDFIRFKDFSALIDGKFLLPVARYTGTTDHLDFSINVVNKTFNFTLSDAWSGKFDNMTFDIEYTKIID